MLPQARLLSINMAVEPHGRREIVREALTPQIVYASFSHPLSFLSQVEPNLKATAIAGRASMTYAFSRQWNLGTTYRRRAFIVCEGSPASSPIPRRAPSQTSAEWKSRSAPGSAITRAGGMTAARARRYSAFWSATGTTTYGGLT